VTGPSPITPGQFAADQYDGTVTGDGDVGELIRGLDSIRRLNHATAAIETTRASAGRPEPSDELDSMDREDLARRYFVSVVGRPPHPWELNGAPIYGCHACARMGEGCDEHRRPLGSAIPLPPRPWPSDPGPDDAKHAPYSLTRSVG
jgi:hypothetical protein